MNWRIFIGSDVWPACIANHIAMGRLVSDDRGRWVEPTERRVGASLAELRALAEAARREAWTGGTSGQ